MAKNLGLATSIGLTGKPETYSNIAFANQQQKRKDKEQDEADFREFDGLIRSNLDKVHTYHNEENLQNARDFLGMALKERQNNPQGWRNKVLPEFYNWKTKQNELLNSSQQLYGYEKAAREGKSLVDERLVSWFNDPKNQGKELPPELARNAPIFGASYSQNQQGRGRFAFSPTEKIDIEQYNDQRLLGRDELYTELGSPYKTGNIAGEITYAQDRTIPMDSYDAFVASALQDKGIAQNFAARLIRENPDLDFSLPETQQFAAKAYKDMLLGKNAKKMKLGETRVPQGSGSSNSSGAGVVTDEAFLVNTAKIGDDGKYQGVQDVKVVSKKSTGGLVSDPVSPITVSDDMIVYDNLGDKPPTGELLFNPGSMKLVPVWRKDIGVKEQGGDKKLLKRIGGTLVPADRLDQANPEYYTWELMVSGKGTRKEVIKDEVSGFEDEITKEYSIFSPYKKHLAVLTSKQNNVNVKEFEAERDRLNEERKSRTNTQAKTDQKATKDWSKYKR